MSYRNACPPSLSRSYCSAKQCGPLVRGCDSYAGLPKIGFAVTDEQLTGTAVLALVASLASWIDLPCQIARCCRWGWSGRSIEGVARAGPHGCGGDPSERSFGLSLPPSVPLRRCARFCGGVCWTVACFRRVVGARRLAILGMKHRNRQASVPRLLREADRAVVPCRRVQLRYEISVDGQDRVLTLCSTADGSALGGN